MPAARSAEASLFPAGLLLLLFVIIGGCGGRDWDEQLPGGYVLSSPWSGCNVISKADGTGVVPDEIGHTITGLATHGGFVMGQVKFDPNSPTPYSGPRTVPYYFILDTSNRFLHVCDNHDEWTHDLRLLSLSEPSLEYPTSPLIRWVVRILQASLLVAALVAFAVVWIVRRARRKRTLVASRR